MASSNLPDPRRECASAAALALQVISLPLSHLGNPWEIDGETVSDFIFLGSKITADGDYSHEIKRRLLLEEQL